MVYAAALAMQRARRVCDEWFKIDHHFKRSYEADT
jgi:hypothetical protein